MAKSKRTSRRTEQCCYVEGGQRCRRSGTGDPTFCNPHRIVMAEASKPPKPFGSGVADLLDRVVNGRKINRKVVESAFDDVVTAWATGQPRQPSPPPQPDAPPEPWWRQAQRAAQGAAQNARRAPPPPPDPKIEERKQARRVMGFGPSEQLTADMIKDKRKLLARKHHPDRGGSTTKMQAVNAAADVLLASL